jgi:hypothetical protein
VLRGNGMRVLLWLIVLIETESFDGYVHGGGMGVHEAWLTRASGAARVGCRRAARRRAQTTYNASGRLRGMVGRTQRERGFGADVREKLARRGSGHMACVRFSLNRFPALRGAGEGRRVAAHRDMRRK